MSKDPPRRWTAMEDQLLREGFAAQAAGNKNRATNWNELAKRIPGRTNKDCRKRYYNNAAGNLKKGTWTEEEDNKLKRFVEEYGPSWAVIGQCMENRSAEQCSKRWNHCLDPKLERQAWTKEEDQLLLRAVRYHGTSWKDIQTLHFGCRSANNVKNRHTIISRKSLSAPADAPPCCPHQRQESPTSDTSDTSEDQAQSPKCDLTSEDSQLTNSETADTLQHSIPGATDVEMSENGLVGVSSFEDWNRPFPWEASEFSELDPFHAFTDPTPTPIAKDMIYFSGPHETAGSSRILDDLNLDLGNMHGNEYGFQSSEQHFNTDSNTRNSLGSDQALVSPFPAGMISDSGSNRQSIGGISGAQGPGSPSNSRYTITIDGAEPDTVMQVMNILVTSRAMVNFQSAQNES